MRLPAGLVALAVLAGATLVSTAEGGRRDRPPAPRLTSGGHTVTAYIDFFCLRGRGCRVTDPPPGERWPVLRARRGARVQVDTRWPARRVMAYVVESDLMRFVRVARVDESRRRWRLRVPARIAAHSLGVEAIYTRRRGRVEATVWLQKPR